MIEKVEMFTINCDNCGENIGADNDFMAMNDEAGIKEYAMNDDWIEEGDKHYCKKCYSYDDNDELVIKSK